MAKRGLGVRVLDPKAASAVGNNLVQTIHGLARKVGLAKMPEMGTVILRDNSVVLRESGGPRKFTDSNIFFARIKSFSLSSWVPRFRGGRRNCREG